MRPLTKKEYLKVISEFEIENEEIAYKYLKEKKKQTHLNLLFDILDFNPSVIPSLNPLFINDEEITFLIKCRDELTRKLSVSDFLMLCNMLRVTKKFFNFDTLAEMKRLHGKIKPA